MRIRIGLLLPAIACCLLFAAQAQATDYVYGYTSIYVDSGNEVRGYHRTELDYNSDLYYTPYVCGSLSKDGVEIVRACQGGYHSATRNTNWANFAGSTYSALSDHYVDIAYQEEDPNNPGYYSFADFFGYGFAGSGGHPIDWYWVATAVSNLRPEQSIHLGDTSVTIGPHINNISPSRGAVGTTVPVSIFGNGFSQQSSNTVQVSGSGVTVSDVNFINSGVLSANFQITADASAGNHAVTVTRSGFTSNSVNFFVQIPSKLLPYTDSSLAPNGVGPLNTPVNQDVRTLEGVLVAPNFCGVYRSYLFFLADQEGQRIQTAFTFDEIFSNINTLPGLANVTYTPVNFPANYVAIEDLQTLGFQGGCLNNNEFQTFTQKFKITINGTPYFPTTTINIKRGNEGGVLKVDRTITTP